MSHNFPARLDARTRLSPSQMGIAGYVAPLVVTGTITGTAAAQGGYFATSWGWTGLVLAWAIGVAAVLGGGLATPSRLAGAFLATVAAVLAWVLGSSLWSIAPWESVLEAERTLVYLLGAAFVLLTARRHLGAMYGGVLLADALVSSYGLGTRLFPDRLGVFDPVAGYRLAEPIGYWNGLGIFAALGVLLATGLAVEAERPATRAAAAAALPVLLLTQYFTFSRAGWLALCVGLVVSVSVTPRKLRSITAVLALAVPSGLAVLVASRETPLTHIGASLSATAHAGHRVALVLVGLAAASAAIAASFGWAARTIHVGRRVRLAYASLLVAVAVAASSSVMIAVGSPISLTKRAYDSFTSPPPAWVPPEQRAGTNLDQRLFSFSGSGRALLWRVALDDYRNHPLLGSGAGTFQRAWIRSPKSDFNVHDAHSLYIETLAELGPVGLVLVLILFTLPLAAAWRARRSPYTIGAAGAYVAFFIHAGVDWDWELSGVTLTAICCGALLIAVCDQGRSTRQTLRPAACLAVLAPLAAFSLIALVGNNALAGSQHALQNHDWVRAQQLARRATTWMPWSPSPWTALGEAQLEGGSTTDAHASFLRAISHGDGDWEAWLGLARASSGPQRAAALVHAEQLNRAVSGT
jgi:hypothetical protein